MMALRDLHLAEHPFLKDLTAQQIQDVAGCAVDARFEAGTFIFHAGESATRFYIITHGAVALEIFVPGRGAMTIVTLHAGEALGWSWLFPPYHWHFDARALEPTTAIAFDAPCLRALCDADHDLGFRLMTRIAHTIGERLQATRLQLLDVYGVHPGPEDYQL
jgi:CRP-like cAMP-binding protein